MTDPETIDMGEAEFSIEAIANAWKGLGLPIDRSDPRSVIDAALAAAAKGPATPKFLTPNEVANLRMWALANAKTWAPSQTDAEVFDLAARISVFLVSGQVRSAARGGHLDA